MFLELVRLKSKQDPDLARRALAGLAAYERAERPEPRPQRPEIARVRGACLRDHGGSGAPAVLVPSLINPPNILDLDGQVSLAEAVKAMGRRVLLLDWGEARDRSGLSVTAHVEQLLVPLLRELGEPPALIGYCLGGTMAIAAANLAPVERLVTIAAPWRFGLYPEDSRAALDSLWRTAAPAVESLGAMPMELLQAAFWSLDPGRTVAKFAAFAGMEPGSPQARRFVALEDWANSGEPLPLPAARELIEDFFAADLPGRGRWQVAGRATSGDVAVESLHLTASRDRIAPADTAPAGPTVQIAAGHVGMVVGSARRQLHEALGGFLAPACR